MQPTFYNGNASDIGYRVDENGDPLYLWEADDGLDYIQVCKLYVYTYVIYEIVYYFCLIFFYKRIYIYGCGITNRMLKCRVSIFTRVSSMRVSRMRT